MTHVKALQAGHSIQGTSEPITPALAPLRKFFRAAVRNLTSVYENRVYAQSEQDTQPSICSQMRRDMSQESHGDIASAYLDQGYEIPEVESLSPVVGTQMRSVTPNNRSLTYLQSGPFDQPQCYLPLARGSVSSVSLAISDLLSYVEPLPLDQLVSHSADTVRSWPVTARNELLAVAHRDMAVARRNLRLYYRQPPPREVWTFRLQVLCYVIIIMSSIIRLIDFGCSILYYMFEFILRLKSDYVWYFYYALFVPFMFHLIITYIPFLILYGVSLCMLYICLLNRLRLLDNKRLYLGGVRLTFYTMLV